MKNNRYGQSAIISNSEYSKIRREIKSSKYKLLLDLAWYTGERWGALVQLKFENVYHTDGKPRETITFRANTRKASPDGKRETRQIPVHPNLFESLSSYKVECFDSLNYLFPGQKPGTHLTLRLADKILRAAVTRAELEHKGISTHSTRRSFITKLHEKGTDIYLIQQITGHKDLKALSKYIEVRADRIAGAIASL